MRAFEPGSFGDNITAFDLGLGAERVNTFNMNVDGTDTDNAAAGQRNLCLTEFCQKRAQHTEGSAHR